MPRIRSSHGALGLPTGHKLYKIAGLFGLSAAEKCEQALLIRNERSQPWVAVGQLGNAARSFCLSVGRIEPGESYLPSIGSILRTLAVGEKQIVVIDKLKA